jgi:hypothetical protein
MAIVNHYWYSNKLYVIGQSALLFSKPDMIRARKGVQRLDISGRERTNHSL